ncbi:MAG TPA: cytidylate kinase-like family protein [Gemmatimonadaceae bacterium]|nr:cytidylate kinase-like family protein [Gemmatimonadaceae bacterium]
MPIITISRLYGSGGSEVAGRVAAGLGWTLLDTEIVDRVARRMRTTPAAVQALDERVPSFAERVARLLALGDLGTTGEFQVPTTGDALAPADERQIVETERVIREAAARGPAVVVGRGAQAMLAERADAMHVFVYAPRDALVRRVMAREPGARGRAEAERLVDETNRQREQYVRRHWDRAWRAHENYDLCVNTAWLGVDGAAALVVDAARRKLGA